jgi:hypothetical protein
MDCIELVYTMRAKLIWLLSEIWDIAKGSEPADALSLIHVRPSRCGFGMSLRTPVLIYP